MGETPDWSGLLLGLIIGVPLGMLIARVIDIWTAIRMHAKDKDQADG